MKYIKQLDTIRAFAVILVIIHHWNWTPITQWIDKFNAGGIGVDVFFVLSGFLISKILMKQRDQAERNVISKMVLIKNFYIRRALRIFPIYYITIFVLITFSEHTDTNIKSSYIYFLTYTSNYYFFHAQEWDGIISHFWSLAVEEQFYLLWPWIILFTNKKYLPYVISFFILIGVVGQIFMRDIKMMDLLTFNCFDSFGIGAILSWIVTYKKDKVKILYSYFLILALLGASLFVIGFSINFWPLPFRTINSLMTIWLILYILLHNADNSLKFSWILNNKILIFIGKLSYGIYLYHLLIPDFVVILNRKLSFNVFPSTSIKFFIFECIVLLFLASFLSYELIEKRFLNLKKYFEYKS